MYVTLYSPGTIPSLRLKAQVLTEVHEASHNLALSCPAFFPFPLLSLLHSTRSLLVDSRTHMHSLLLYGSAVFLNLTARNTPFPITHIVCFSTTLRHLACPDSNPNPGISAVLIYYFIIYLFIMFIFHCLCLPLEGNSMRAGVVVCFVHWWIPSTWRWYWYMLGIWQTLVE